MRNNSLLYWRNEVIARKRIDVGCRLDLLELVCLRIRVRAGPISLMVGLIEFESCFSGRLCLREGVKYVHAREMSRRERLGPALMNFELGKILLTLWRLGRSPV